MLEGLHHITKLVGKDKLCLQQFFELDVTATDNME